MSKVLFIAHSSGFAGGEICMLESVQSLIMESKFEIHAALPEHTESKLANELTKSKAIIHRGIKNQYWVGGKTKRRRVKVQRILDTIQGFFQAIGLIIKIRPKYVVINSFVTNPVFAIASRMFNCKTIWFIHELVDLDHGWSFYLGKKFSFNFIKFISHKIVFNSQFTFNHFVEQKNSKNKKFQILDYAVTQNIIESLVNENIKRDIENFSNPIKFLIAGRTSAGKGQEDIVKAFAILINEKGIKNIFLTILGAIRNSYRDKLMEIVKESNIENYVEFISFTNDPASCFSAATFGITTSRNESFGRITVEYMKYGLVTIGAKAGATAEIIENDVTGYFYEVNNENNLAEKIETILNNRQNLNAIVTNAIKYSNNRHNLKNHGIELNKILLSI